MSVRIAAAALMTMAALVVSSRCARADDPLPLVVLPSVQVVGTTPLPGFGTPLRDVPANVQIFGNGAIAASQSPTLTQFLDRNANSAGAASGQGNPFQQSLAFRGFAASPLLGTPQGLSVFQDGVRINEAFGDVVNWDLLPASAISGIQLIPGSVPAFGLNTLGGALAIRTKNGAQYPGTSVELSGGSFDRRAIEFEYGHADAGSDVFATANLADAGGFAQHGASRVRQFFGKLGFQGNRGDFDVSVTLADNALQGAQTLPQSFLVDPRQAYTYPDINQNRLAFLVAKGSSKPDDSTLVDTTAYFRSYRNINISSNVNDSYGAIDPDTGVAQANPATNDRSTIDQSSFGAAVQWTRASALAGHAHQLAIGAGADFGLTHFAQAGQPASFTSDRGTIGIAPYSATTAVALSNAYWGAYASDTLTLADAWVLTMSARYNIAQVSIDDRSGHDAALDGTHRYSRINPAVGINFNPTPALTAYAGYNEGMRAPTPIELTCADPAAPCKLPNEFLADPPLSEVVSKSLEAGARGTWGSATTWSVAFYRSDLANDIAFIASGTGAVNAGYFQNVGRTRRQGIELAATMRLSTVTIAARYSAIDATFRSTFDAASPNNSAADTAGAIVVHPGDRIPGVPAQTAKLRIDWDAAPGVSIGGSLVAVSSQYARGDENNADRRGRVPGHFVASLDTRYDIAPRTQLIAQVVNLFDRRYADFALLGANAFTGPGRSFGPAAGIAPVPEQFRALGATRTVWIGVRVRFDERARAR